MKVIKGFNKFTYNPLLEKLEDNQLIEQLSIGKYQRSLQKFYKDSGYYLYYASTYNTATLVLIPVIEKLFPYFSMEESLMLTVFSIAVLTNESKSKVENLYKYLLEHNIVDEEIEKTVTVLTNIYEIFKAILKVSGEELNMFADMLSSTGILVPFLSVFGNLITNGFIDSELFTKQLQDIKTELGEKGFRLLLHRILHKLNIMTKNTDKFQNKDNVKPLKVNDEFKSPQYKTEDVVLEEKLSLDDMTTDVKSKVEKSRKLSKEMKEKILPLIVQKGIHGTTYNKGRVAYLKIPKVTGKSFKGVSLGADKNGFYVMTHRARSKSYPEFSDIPNKDIKFIESTG